MSVLKVFMISLTPSAYAIAKLLYNTFLWLIATIIAIRFLSFSIVLYSSISSFTVVGFPYSASKHCLA